MGKWYSPKRKSGFHKSKSASDNVRVMMRNAPKNYSAERKLRLVGRQAQALANVTKDKMTEKKARSTARLAFNRLRKKR